MTHLASCLVAAAVALMLSQPAAAPPSVAIEPAAIAFGTVLEGVVIEPQVTVRNTGSQPLVLRGAQMLAPLVATRMPATIGPGETATLRFRLDTASLLGPFESDVVLLGPDNVEVGHFVVEGRVIPVVASEPGVVLLATLPGERKSTTTLIVNHGADPVEVTLERAPEHLTARLSVIEAGKRYRLDVESSGSAPVGRHRLAVMFSTTSPRRPTFSVPINLLVRARVYTFPEQVEFGRLSASDARRQPTALTQTLMVYQQGGHAFQARFETDVAGLAITAEQGPSRDRWQATLRLDPHAHALGEIRGQVVITTNDPEFPRITVPVVGALTK